MFSQIHLRFILFIAVLLSLGCHPSKIERLEQEVLALHDEVMPEMDQMKSLRRQLISKPYGSKADSMRFMTAARSLRIADSLMWVWMYQYVPVTTLSDSLGQSQIEAYLIDQRKLIQAVSDSMKMSMVRAESLIDG